MSDMQYAIDARNLSKSFGNKVAVSNITIQVPKGKVYGFLGPNGSGKTTTIRMICGLLTPDSGEGTCLGHNILLHSEQIKSQIGYMTQKFSYWEDLTIKENLEFVAQMFSLENKAEKVKQAIHRLGLEKRCNQLAGSLSGGWKQRLALAACTLHDPKILLLDEPTAGVDPKARREFWDEIHQLATKGLTVLVSTHYMDEAERCHKIIYTAGGQLIIQGSVAEVIANTHLTTWVVKGTDLSLLQTALADHTAISTIAPFGDSLHISGTNPERLKQAITPYLQQSNYHWELINPSMEDAFIHYMNNAQEREI